MADAKVDCATAYGVSAAAAAVDGSYGAVGCVVVIDSTQALLRKRSTPDERSRLLAVCTVTVAVHDDQNSGGPEGLCC